RRSRGRGARTRRRQTCARRACRAHAGRARGRRRRAGRRAGRPGARPRRRPRPRGPGAQGRAAATPQTQVGGEQAAQTREVALMGMLGWVMMGLAIWHFTIFLPDRFWGGIVGAFLGSLVGAVVVGLIIYSVKVSSLQVP